MKLYFAPQTKAIRVLTMLDARHHLLSDFPVLDAYAKRMLARPSLQRAITPPGETASART